MRTMAVAVSLLFGLVPNPATGQTSIAASAPSGTGHEGGERLTLQVAGGPTLSDRGKILSAAFGYSPASRLELLLNIECSYRALHLEPSNRGYSGGGGLMFASGELRLALRPPDRVSPFAVAGAGGGVSRPDVDVTHGSSNLFVVYVGGGVRVPLRRGFSLFGDARIIIDVENEDRVSRVWPVRAGVAWRF